MAEPDPFPAGRPLEPANATILLVDDEPANLAVLNALLRPHYRVRVARSGAETLRATATAPYPDLILLDVMMPEMDGYTVLSRLREQPHTRSVPVIFVTALDSTENEQRGLELGAADYITKPISPAIVLARVRTQLALKAAQDQLLGQNAALEALVVKRTQALKMALETAEKDHSAMRQSYFGTLMAISALVELRGPAIGGHSRRVADVARKTATLLGLDSDEVQEIFVAALLHDIGKIGLPESVLKRPHADLSPDDFALYRKHPALGAEALDKIQALAGIADQLRNHHEHFDGSGFPAGRSGLDIPIGARIIAAASDYDDYLSGSISGKPMSKCDSRRRLVEGSGIRYDPLVIEQMEPLLAQDDDEQLMEIRVVSAQLKAGMTMARDVRHPQGFLLLSKGSRLETKTIRQLTGIEQQSGAPLEMYVYHTRA